MELTQLFIYPVKGARAVATRDAWVTRRGLAHDRRCMVVDERGRFLSQREHPTLALLRAVVDGDVLTLDAPGRAPVSAKLEESATAARRVEVWGDAVDAVDLGEPTATWLTSWLERPARLVYMPDQSLRPVDPRYRANEDDVTSFADGFPLLLVSTESVAELGRRLTAAGKSSVGVDRFRANLVVSGFEAFAEDAFRSVRVGRIRFHVAKPCARCVVITVDQATGRKTDEPLATLATFRRSDADDGGVVFGQNLVPLDTGIVRVGDPVVVER